MTHPYGDSIGAIVNDLIPGSFDALEDFEQINHPNTSKVLISILQYACGSSKARAIIVGREAFGRLPKPWLEKHLPDAISQSIDFSDYWEYRRLLELLDEHFPKLLERYSKMGLNSDDEDVRSAAEFGMRQLKEGHGGISPESSHITSKDR